MKKMKSKMMLATNGSEREENDFYATHPSAVKLFLQRAKETNLKLNNSVWECACGQGHISEVLKEYGYDVYSTDLINRGYGTCCDFINNDYTEWQGDILTNPPYKLAEEFLQKGMNLLQDGNKLIMFLKVQFLESKGRKELFDKYPPKYVYVHSERQQCSKNADFEQYKCTTLCFCWYVWEKGFNGEPTIRWI